MNQFKKAQVLLLPTEKASQICIYNKELYYVIDGEFNLNRDKYNIYITTDDKIEKGDYFYNTELNRVVEATSIKYPNERNKIIATTDTSLNSTQVVKEFITKEGIHKAKLKSGLPKPSQQYIELYIESYNKDKVIESIMVEYETSNKMSEHYVTNRILINQDNTINIKQIKDSWNREEVIYNVIKHRNDFLKFKTSSYYNPNDKEIKEWENNWVKENL